MIDLVCVGGPAHGMTVNDVGAFLSVPVDTGRDLNALLDFPTLRHGPGYRRLPKFEPRERYLARYIKRRIFDGENIVTVYAMSDYTDDVLLADYRTAIQGKPEGVPA